MEIQLWREILNPYELAVEEILVKFNHLKREFKEQGIYCPIEEVHGRVKAITSIIEKAHKKHIKIKDVEEQLEDIAGIRVICQFVEDIEQVVELIRMRDDMEIKREKDYITNMKPSGYRSYHLVVYYTVQTLKGPKRLKVEIQIRTLAMNFWATIEHSIQYKYKHSMPEHINERLMAASNAIITLDDEMSEIRSEIMDAQNSFQIKANTVSDILNNIQNLFFVANRKEVEKIQDEFYAIYSENDLEELKRFQKQLDTIAESYRAQKLVHNMPISHT